MNALDLRLTYIGGSTVLLDLGGVRLLTDPTFDPAGTEYRTSAYTLRKTQDPALLPDAVGALELRKTARCVPCDPPLNSVATRLDDPDRIAQMALGLSGMENEVPSLPFAPEIVLPTLAHYHRTYPQLHQKYGFTCSLNPTFPGDSLSGKLSYEYTTHADGSVTAPNGTRTGTSRKGLEDLRGEIFHCVSREPDRRHSDSRSRPTLP